MIWSASGIPNHVRKCNNGCQFEGHSGIKQWQMHNSVTHFMCTFTHFMCIFTHSHTHTHAKTHTHTYTCEHTNTHTHVNTNTHTLGVPLAFSRPSITIFSHSACWIILLLQIFFQLSLTDRCVAPVECMMWSISMQGQVYMIHHVLNT